MAPKKSTFLSAILSSACKYLVLCLIVIMIVRCAIRLGANLKPIDISIFKIKRFEIEVTDLNRITGLDFRKIIQNITGQSDNIGIFKFL